jgi:hypothetical protein
MGFLPAPVDVATLTSFSLSEYTLHSWDVRVGFEQAATLDPQATPLLMESSPLRLEWLAKPEALKGKQATERVKTSDPDRSLALHLGDHVSMTPGAPEAFEATLSLPAESLLRLIAGRLSIAHTPAQVALDGVDVDLRDVRGVFPGF